MTVSAESFWELLKPTAGVYTPQAFVFVQEGLRHTVERLYDTPDDDDASLDMMEGERHVSGQQLCLGLRDYALKEFGLLARTVLNSWQIHSTQDFGRIVFIMVEAGLMRKSNEDRSEDFVGVFDFDEVFGTELEPC